VSSRRTFSIWSALTFLRFSCVSDSSFHGE